MRVEKKREKRGKNMFVKPFNQKNVVKVDMGGAEAALCFNS
jgi:hypothetical protein